MGTWSLAAIAGIMLESGLNDGLCVPALVIALALADTEAHALTGSEAAQVVAESIGYGLLMGAVASLAAATVQRRPAPSRDEERVQWRWLLSPVVAALAFGLAAPLGDSGFIAAFVAGLVFGAVVIRYATPRGRCRPRTSARC